jgi:hypothetical protein
MYTASFTLFQLITLDDWFELYDEIRATEASDGVHDGVHPVFLYFFVFIVTENFIFVNLFTAVIVNNLEIHQQKQLSTATLTSHGGGDDAGSSASGRSDSRPHESDAPHEVRAHSHAASGVGDSSFVDTAVAPVNHGMHRYPPGSGQNHVFGHRHWGYQPNGGSVAWHHTTNPDSAATWGALMTSTAAAARWTSSSKSSNSTR